MQEANEPLVHQLNSNPAPNPYKKTLLFGIGIIVTGVLSGYLLASVFGRPGLRGAGDLKIGGPNSKVVGSSDTKTFKDSAEGTVKAGGINEEGTHRLLRSGGESQTVALTSSVLDLIQFEGKKVKVWGETFAAQKAGWLMDVGKVELQE